MKIKYKFTLIITSILIVLGLSLNISVRKILKDNMESSITSSMKEVMKSTRESIKYTLSQRNYLYKDKALKEEANYLLDYISQNFDSTLQICDISGNVLASNLSFKPIEISQNLSEVKEGKTIVNIKYKNNELIGILSYPIIINESYIGIINLNKDYTPLYEEYYKATNILTLIEIILIVFIFLLSTRLTNKIAKPITNLTIAAKSLGEGNYDVLLNTEGTDEISILSREFLNMKNKIKEQILDIESEKEKVERLALSRKIFFDTVTHELKTPLTSIIGYSEMILENVVDDEEFKKRAVSRIYSESQRLNTLVLEIIKISKGLSSIKEEYIEFNIKELLEQVIADMSIKAEKYNLNIIYNLEDSILKIKVNKIKEVFINLIDNAIKYSNNIDDNNIEIHGYMEDNFYKVSVINEANPIPEEIYSHVFEPFIKINSDEDNYSSGLGLYLCSEIIKDHNGSITLSNGNKVEATVSLPY